VNESLPESTSERIVTLMLAATGFVSNIGYEGEDGHWEEMAETSE